MQSSENESTSVKPKDGEPVFAEPTTEKTTPIDPIEKTSKKKRKKSEHIDDYDNPWKLIIETYFENFLEFFFPLAHQDIDWDRRPEFLSQELQQIGKEGGRRGLG